MHIKLARRLPPSGAGGARPGGPPSDRPGRGDAVLLSGSSRDFSGQLAWMETLMEDRAKAAQDHWGSQLVMKERNPLRIFWSLLIVILLVYTGTIFVYRICFQDFKIPFGRPDSHTGPNAWDDFWYTLDDVVYYIFVADLFANFFFSYHDEKLGHEIDSLRLIAASYLRGTFLVNLLGCIPSKMISMAALTAGGGGNSAQNANLAVRVFRLQRLSRLIRLLSLARVATTGLQSRIPMLRWMRQRKGGRVVGSILRLAWVVHILACGWYLCAALAEDPENTWVYRRKVDGHQVVPLLERPSLEQWMNCMYFVLTVFTTVGFGDINACSMGEIVYVFCTMVVGAIIHSIIVSEVITVITAHDQVKEFIMQQTRLVEKFAEHAEVGDEAVQDIKSWIRLSAKYQTHLRSDIAEMRHLLTGPELPRSLLAQLPGFLYQGRLVRNGFFGEPRFADKVPPRLAVLVALACQRLACQSGQVLYSLSDYPANLFLVLSGTFAYVAEPTNEGGQRRVVKLHMHQRALTSTLRVGPPLFPYQLFSAGTYFGDGELLIQRPRQTTARCESEGGVVLVLHTNDLKALMKDFPEFARKWKSAAQDRILVRKRRQAKMTDGFCYLHLAATTIQRQWRDQQYSLVPRSPSKLATAIGLAKGVLEEAMLSSGTDAAEGVPFTEGEERRDLAAQVDHLSARIDALQATSAAQVRQLCERMEALQEAGIAHFNELRTEILMFRSSLVGI